MRTEKSRALFSSWPAPSELGRAWGWQALKNRNYRIVRHHALANLRRIMTAHRRRDARTSVGLKGHRDGMTVPAKCARLRAELDGHESHLSVA